MAVRKSQVVVVVVVASGSIGGGELVSDLVDATRGVGVDGAKELLHLR